MTKKSYNKFVATAATATLVASAIAPVAASADSKQFTDVNERYAPAVDYVVSKGVQGKTSTQFGVQDSIKRVDAAVFIANALDLNKPGSPDAGFSDVPARAKDAVNALKEKGIINGKTDTRYGANDVLTRGEVALILASAYNLKGDANSVKFTDVNKNRYGSAVAGLVDAGVTDGISDTKFGTENPVKRGDLAVFLYKLSGETPEVPSTDGITSVEAINDTTVEVKFGKAIDKDFIREAERNGEYFRVFLQGDSASSDKAIKSSTITFENDGKTARFTLGETVDGDDKNNVLDSGKKYTVALTNGENKTADVIHEYGPVELKGSAAKPEFNVDAVADKIFVKFGEKMKSSALEVENYEVYDEGGKKLGNLEDFVKETDKGTWVDATKKTEVEFTLDPKADKKLLAGKTYKLYVKEDVKTDKNKTLSEKDRTISVKTPSINEAKPKAVMARVIDETEIVVVFDKDIDEEITANKNQVEVKTTTGKTVKVNDVEVGDKANEIKITVAGGDDDKLNKDTTYNVDLPANAVTNAVFPNASNDAVSKLKAEAQDDVEIKSVKADLKASPKNKKRADLYLSFDQRPNLDTIKWSEVVIKDGSDVYTVNETKAKENAKYNGNKEIVIENVSEVFEMGSDEFNPEKGTTYTLEIKTDGVETDSFGDKKGKTNQSKLKATFGGVSVNAPAVDKVTLVSEKEIKVDFKEDISSISEDDVYVAGVELYSNGNFGAITLNGTDHLSASVSGSTLTLKTKGDTAFHTGFEDTNIEIKANAFTSKDNKVENDLIEINGDNYDDYKNVDNAAPVMIGASTDGGSVNNDQVLLTFSESLEEHGDSDKIATLFSVKNAANNAVGKEISVNGNEVLVTFNDVVFDEDTVMSKVEVTYNAGGSFYLKDEKGNKAAKATVKGIKGKNPEANAGNGGNNGGGEKPTDPEQPTEGDTVKVSELADVQIKDALGSVQLVIPTSSVSEDLQKEDELTLNYNGKTYTMTKTKSGKNYQYTFANEKVDGEDVKAKATISK